jgi:hypothetical protein
MDHGWADDATFTRVLADDIDAPGTAEHRWRFVTWYRDVRSGLVETEFERLVDDGPPVALVEETSVELFERAADARADLRDPTPELVALVIEGAPDRAGLRAAIEVLNVYFCFLREHEGWRRSEANTRLCWDALDTALERDDFEGGLVALLTGALEPVWSGAAVRPAEQLGEAVDRPFARAVATFLGELGATGLPTRDGGPDEQTLAYLCDLLGVAPADGPIWERPALTAWWRALAVTGVIRVTATRVDRGPAAETLARGAEPERHRLLQRLVTVLALESVRRLEETATAYGASVPTAHLLLQLLAACVPDEFGGRTSAEVAAAATEMLVLNEMAGERTSAAAAPAARAVLDDLTAMGLLTPDGERFGVPAGLLPVVARAVDRVNKTCVYLTDADPWQPVRDRSPHRPGVLAVLRLELVGASRPSWREVVIAADSSLAALARTIQGAFDWGGGFPYVFLDGTGHRRYARGRDLRRFREASDALVSEAESVDVGAALLAAGDEIGFAYPLGASWQVAVRLESLLVGTLTGGAGEAPSDVVGGRPLAEVRRRAEILSSLTGVLPRHIGDTVRYGWTNGLGDAVAWHFTPDDRALLLVFDQGSALNRVGETVGASAHLGYYDGLPVDLAALARRPDPDELLPALVDERGAVLAATGIFWYDAAGREWRAAPGLWTACDEAGLDLWPASGVERCLQDYRFAQPLTAEAVIDEPITELAASWSPDFVRQMFVGR